MICLPENGKVAEGEIRHGAYLGAFPGDNGRSGLNRYCHIPNIFPTILHTGSSVGNTVLRSQCNNLGFVDSVRRIHLFIQERAHRFCIRDTSIGL